MRGCKSRRLTILSREVEGISLVSGRGDEGVVVGVLHRVRKAPSEGIFVAVTGWR